VPHTDLAVDAFRGQIRAAGPGPWLFPSDENPTGHQKTLKTVWHATLRRAKVPYFRIYDLRSTYATRLSAGGVADEWVTQLFRATRREGVQEVLADETADEKGCAAEDQPEGE
jgi:integrase